MHCEKPTFVIAVVCKQQKAKQIRCLVEVAAFRILGNGVLKAEKREAFRVLGN
jgi:hypothetical protein